MDACAAVLVLFELGRRGKEGREIKGEKSHMQGCIFLKNFFFFASRSQTKTKENWKKKHIVTEKQTKTNRLIISGNRTNN